MGCPNGGIREENKLQKSTKVMLGQQVFFIALHVFFLIKVTDCDKQSVWWNSPTDLTGVPLGVPQLPQMPSARGST